MHLTSIITQTSPSSLVNYYWQRLAYGFEISWRALLEILLIGIVVHSVLRFLEGTRGARLMQAVLTVLLGVVVIAFGAQVLALDRITVLYPYFVAGSFLIALVVFQPELRRGLIRIGETLGRQGKSARSHRVIEQVVQAMASLSRRKIGAIVAIERRVGIGGLMETGVRLDAEVSRELLETIFWPGSALHDLGVIVSQNRLAAAGCEFPLAEADTANRIIGSRHRAALGVSSDSDALVVVVSEETGTISIAARGQLKRELTPDQLRDYLTDGMLGIEEGTQPAAGTQLDAAAEAGLHADGDADASEKRSDTTGVAPKADDSVGGASSDVSDVVAPLTQATKTAG